MKKNIAGRETRLTVVIQPATEEGGGRGGGSTKQWAQKEEGVIRETDQSTGKTQARAAADEDEVKESTLQYLKQWMGWGRSFWFHSSDGVAPDQATGWVL